MRGRLARADVPIGTICKALVKAGALTDRATTTAPLIAMARRYRLLFRCYFNRPFAPELGGRRHAEADVSLQEQALGAAKRPRPLPCVKRRPGLATGTNLGGGADDRFSQ